MGFFNGGGTFWDCITMGFPVSRRTLDYAEGTLDDINFDFGKYVGLQ